MIGFSILSILIGLIAFGIPMIYGMISCTKYLFSGPFQVSTIDAYSKEYNSILDMSDKHIFTKPIIKRWSYAEAISMGVAPVMGVIVSFFFSEIKVPFDPLYSASAITFIAVGYVSYWLSRRFRTDLPLSINLLLPYGILIGIFCYIFLFLHFISLSTALALAFASLIAFPMLAPLPATFFALRQFQIQRAYLKKSIKQKEDSGEYIDNWTRNLSFNNFVNPLVLAGIIISILGILFLAGQPLDGFWQAFRGSHGFLFSIEDLNI